MKKWNRIWKWWCQKIRLWMVLRWCLIFKLVPEVIITYFYANTIIATILQMCKYKKYKCCTSLSTYRILVNCLLPSATYLDTSLLTVSFYDLTIWNITPFQQANFASLSAEQLYWVNEIAPFDWKLYKNETLSIRDGSKFIGYPGRDHRQGGEAFFWKKIRGAETFLRKN